VAQVPSGGHPSDYYAGRDHFIRPAILVGAPRFVS